MKHLTKSPYWIIVAAFIVLASCKNEEGKSENKKDSTTTQNHQPENIIQLDPNKKYVFFTTDDGPQPPGTNNVLNIMKEANVKGSFFMVGLHNQISPDRRRLTETVKSNYPLVVLASHSMTHGFRDKYRTFYQMVDSAVADMIAGEQALQAPVKIMRLPGMNTWVTKEIEKGPKSSMNVALKLKEKGYSIVGWDVEWAMIKGSTPKQGAQEMADEVLNKFASGTTTQPNAVVLLTHDRLFAKQQYADSLRRFFSILKQDPNIVFETIDHYPSIQPK